MLSRFAMPYCRCSPTNDSRKLRERLPRLRRRSPIRWRWIRIGGRLVALFFLDEVRSGFLFGSGDGSGRFRFDGVRAGIPGPATELREITGHIGEGPVGVLEPLQRMDAGDSVDLLLPRQRFALDVLLKFDGLEFLAGEFVGELDKDMGKAEFFVGDEATLTGDENTLRGEDDGVEKTELADGLGQLRDAGELLPLPIWGADD